MKKCARITAVLILALLAVLGTSGAAFAASAVYEDGADRFVTIDDYGANLFNDFDNAAPGAELKQKIEIVNDAEEDTEVKLYLKLKTYYSDLENCLKNARLKIDAGKEEVVDAAEAYIGGITDDVLIGKCDFNDKKSIDLTLTLPMDLSSEQLNQLKEANWIFTAKKIPKEASDAYAQGELKKSSAWVYVIIAIAVCAAAGGAVLVKKKRRRNRFLNL